MKTPAVSSRDEVVHRALEALMLSGSEEYRTERTRKWATEFEKGRVEGFKEGFAEGYQKEFRESFQLGRYEGGSAALLEVLEARGLQVSASARQRIWACTDLAELKSWLRKAVTIEFVQELFEPRASHKPAAQKGSKRGRSTKASKPRSKR